MLRRLLVPLALTLAVPALGCSGSASTEPAVATPEAATTRAPVAQSTHGPLKLAGDALGDVPLTASQRAAIEKLATDTEARHADARAAHKDLTLAVAAQVQAGQLDRAALQPKIDALVAGLQKAQPADRAAFEQLHALLTADQRTAFVDAVQARIAERVGQVRDKHPLKQWAEDLGLTEDQRSQIKAAMKAEWQAVAQGHDGHGGPPWGEAKERGAKVMSAFKQDRFVMDEVAPAMDVAAKAQKMSEHMLGIAQAALPVLTPQQRAIAAQKLRDRAESLEEMGPGMP
jgi:Spy/CpxP family protein refolding chaperone